MVIREHLPSFLRSIPPLYLAGGTVLVLIAGFFIFHRGTSDTQSASQSTPHVTIASVVDLASQAGPLSVIGTVKSVDQASILSETSGEVVSLSHAIGDHVYAGEIIGQFENSSQQAAVTQAEGSYEAAQAALTKATGATAANSGITSSQAATAAQNAQAALAASMNSLYAALDDAVHAKADTLFNNPRVASPTLEPFTIPDTQLVTNIESERAGLDQQTFANASAAATGSGDIDTRAQTILTDAGTIESFLGNLISALNEAVPSTNISSSAIVADQTTLAAARTEVVNAISALTTAKETYDSDTASAQTAANSADTGTQNDIAAAQASLKSAQGALDAAQAELQKTIIRSPISGTIVSLPITQGDFVSQYSQVAVVSNPSALYVETSVTPTDAQTLSEGNSTTIAQETTGVITFIAPALDPSTGEIEVKVGITGDQSALTDGETVSLSLERTKNAGAAATAAGAQSGTLTIPIVALKITPEGPAVFTITASSTLQSHPVTLGSILGDRVVILTGLTPDMQIVTDARGLSEGESVLVDTSSAAATSTPTL